MTENKMFLQRDANIPVMRYCAFECEYCAFRKFLKLSNCPRCRAGENHSHLEVLQRTPPKTKPRRFLTVGLSGDVSFMPWEELEQVFNYCHKWKDRTFLIQSKNPEVFTKHFINCDNVIIGTTIETNKSTQQDYYLSKAPVPFYRLKAMKELNCRKAITIEPIIDFDIGILSSWITDIAPEFVYVGYCNDRCGGKKLKLPEPRIEKTMQLINDLKRAGIEVREKSMRFAWWE